MDTAKLKSFATAARIQLIAEVNARFDAVLATSSLARVEAPGTVKALERAIRESGNGQEGRNLVIEQVAYTWFNRIIALRFMDANGYTGVGIVSPQRGIDVGQPEILADAKRGHVDTGIVDARTFSYVTELLNGSRKSGDPQGEAYGRLLTEYCRYWNRNMPFMFQSKGDYTELLMPADLLADGSVLAKAVRSLTEEDCNDVEVIGWLYQYYISERKEEVFAGFKRNKKAGAAEIPAATQLFTPDWIVRYLVQNSLGRLWLFNRPHSNLVNQMDYYVEPADKESDYLRVSSPEDLKILDPACGSGHMLTHAFDLLYSIYEEEGYPPSDIPSLILSKNLFGIEIDERAGSLAAFALTMKARARQRGFFAKAVGTNICVLRPIHFDEGELNELCTPHGDRTSEAAFWNQFECADTLGSLIQPNEVLIKPLQKHLQTETATNLLLGALHERAERVLEQAQYLSRRYQVVVANPPYMGSGNISSALSEQLTTHFADGRSDLFAAFLLRGRTLAVPHGQLGFMTPFTWMFIGSYAALRTTLLRDSSISSLVQLEYSGFDGATVPICAFCIVNAPQPSMKGTFIRLSDFRGAANQGPKTLEAIRDPYCAWRFEANSNELMAIPSSPISYWASPATRRTFVDYGSIAEYMFSDGLTKTGDNSRFMRFWWEVSVEDAHDPNRYRPCAKGGAARDYSGNLNSLLVWTPDARSHYQRDNVARITPEYLWGRQGITWTKISSRGATFRLLHGDDIAETAGPSLFLKEGVSEDYLYSILGMLSSKTIWGVLSLINPTLNFQTGDVLRIPYDPETLLQLAPMTRDLVDIATEDWSLIETANGFVSHPLLDASHLSSLICERMNTVLRSFQRTVTEYVGLANQVDEIVGRAFGEVPAPRTHDEVTLFSNAAYRFPSSDSSTAHESMKQELVVELISYAVGCMFGRYSIEKSGLVLANQGETLHEFLQHLPTPSFEPDKDNVIPITDLEWFTDDIVSRFRRFVRTTFGDDQFEENLRFIEESLGEPGKPKSIRTYFLKDFYKDHIQRYKRRPIYWMFSSPKGSFNALIYMHRYTPSTVGTVLNDYLREFQAKLQGELQKLDQLAVAHGASARDKTKASKEAERIRKVLVELDEYEHDVLYPLASRQVDINLDDGVLVNYLRFGRALYRLPEIEKKRSEVETWDWLSKPLDAFDGGSR